MPGLVALWGEQTGREDGERALRVAHALREAPRLERHARTIGGALDRSRECLLVRAHSGALVAEEHAVCPTEHSPRAHQDRLVVCARRARRPRVRRRERRQRAAHRWSGSERRADERSQHPVGEVGVRGGDRSSREEGERSGAGFGVITAVDDRDGLSLRHLLVVRAALGALDAGESRGRSPALARPRDCRAQRRRARLSSAGAPHPVRRHTRRAARTTKARSGPRPSYGVSRAGIPHGGLESRREMREKGSRWQAIPTSGAPTLESPRSFP